MSFDYNFFTKSELANFLNRHSDEFQYILKPHQIILKEKIDKTMNEIRKITSEKSDLIDRFKKDEENIEILLQIQKYDNKWEKLHKKYDELLKLAYGE